MKKILVVLAIVSLFAAGPVWAMEACVHEPTLQSLHMCVEHATMEGHINNAGIATSLLAKDDAAQAAVERGQPAVAINILEAFVNEVSAQAGVHIDTEHAAHLKMHAQMVIDTLQNGR